MRTKKRKILWMMFFAFVFCAAFQSHCIKAEAKVVNSFCTWQYCFLSTGTPKVLILIFSVIFLILKTRSEK